VLSFCAKAVVCVPQLSFFRNFLEKKRFWVISLERYLFWENLAENIEEAHLIEEV